jgi:hypothetical protein
MIKITVLQTDNRLTLDYLLLTKQVNKKFCDYFKFNYNFIYLDISKYDMDLRTAKIFIVNEYLQNSTDDIVVFLDSDAWIQDGFSLRDLIKYLMSNENKQGCYSRDPYVKRNTFINSGSFILKNNEYVKNMYRNLTELVSNDINNKVFPEWEDQYYISNFVLKNKDDFIIFVPEVLNTPFGKVLRHNWCKKSKKLFDDLNNIILLKHEDITYKRSTRRIGKKWSNNSTRSIYRLISKTDIKYNNENVDEKSETNPLLETCLTYPFQHEYYYDTEPYPNVEEYGFQYFVY